MPYGPWVLQGPPHLEGKVLPPAAGASSVKLRLVCFPQAGMGGWAFHGWAKALPDEVEVMPVELPGRNTRVQEPKPESLVELARDAVDGLLPALREKPYALLGHSMGAWLVYEVVKELKRRGEPLPKKVYVSSNRPPHKSGKEHDPDTVAPQLHDLGDEVFWQEFERRYGVNPDLANPRVKQFVGPLLKADFKMLETYTPTDLAFEPLDMDITAMGAEGDDRHTYEQLEEWGMHTWGKFSTQWFKGKEAPGYWATPHRYITDNPGPVTAFLAKDLAPLYA